MTVIVFYGAAKQETAKLCVVKLPDRELLGCQSFELVLAWPNSNPVDGEESAAKAIKDSGTTLVYSRIHPETQWH